MPTRIAIIGPESSGKSTLAAELAQHFKASYTKEIARSYLQKTNGEYQKEDLLIMAKLQLEEEEKAVELSNELVFCDTNTLNFLIWSEVRFGKIDPELKELWKAEDYQLNLLCYPDLPYENDPLREHPSVADRIMLFEKHQTYLDSSNSNYEIIKGVGAERLGNGIGVIEKNFL